MILKSMTGGVNKKKRIFKYFICCLLIVFILLTIHDKKQKCNSDITTSSKSPNKHNNNKTSFFCWFLKTGMSTASSLQQTLKTKDSYHEIVINTQESVNVMENDGKREQQGSLETITLLKEHKSNDVLKSNKVSIDSLLINEGMSDSNTKDSVHNENIKKLKKDSLLNSKQHTTKQVTQKSTTQTPTTKATSTTKKPTKTNPTTINPTTTKQTTAKPTTTKPTILKSTISSTTTPSITQTMKIPANLAPNITSSRLSETHLKCHIPKLDPFHREVKPYIRWSWLNETCKIKQSQSRVENGKLFVYIGESSAQMGKVEEVRLHYIKRVDDYHNKVTNQLIYKRNKSETSDEKQGNFHLTVVELSLIHI